MPCMTVMTDIDSQIEKLSRSILAINPEKTIGYCFLSKYKRDCV